MVPGAGKAPTSGTGTGSLVGGSGGGSRGRLLLSTVQDTCAALTTAGKQNGACTFLGLQ
jgi:hypothetical protein